MDKKFYRVDTAFTCEIKYRGRTFTYDVVPGEFLDSDCDLDDCINFGEVRRHTHEEEPVWMYYSFAKNMRPIRRVLDGVTTLDDAMRIGLDMKAHETLERQRNMLECGIVLAIEDANLLTESGRGIAYNETFICDWH